MRLRPGLLAILDLDTLVARGVTDLDAAARALVSGGAALLQLRGKRAGAAELLDLARRVGPIAKTAGVLFIVNDRVDVAALSGADGVHLGQGDLPPAVARAELGPDAIIGLSTHDEAQLAAADPRVVDYVGFGPIFSTSTKPDAEKVVGLEGLAAACRRSRLPVAAIGGLRLEHVPAIRGAGATFAAVISDLYGRGDVQARARAFAEAWGAIA